jgi:hypothetical protein
MEFRQTKVIAGAIMEALREQFGDPNGSASGDVTDPNEQPAATNG